MYWFDNTLKRVLENPELARLPSPPILIPRVKVGDGDCGDRPTLVVAVAVEARGEKQPVMHWHRGEMMRWTVRYVVLGRQIAQRVRDHRTAAVDVQQVQSV